MINDKSDIYVCRTQDNRETLGFFYYYLKRMEVIQQIPSQCLE